MGNETPVLLCEVYTEEVGEPRRCFDGLANADLTGLAKQLVVTHERRN